MGLEKEVKQFLRQRYPECFTTEQPKDITVLSIDMMQFLKGGLPNEIKTENELLRYITAKIHRPLEANNGICVVIANFDLQSLKLKNQITHTTRYTLTLCDKCKSVEQEIERDEKNFIKMHKIKFHAKCEEKCISKQFITFDRSKKLFTNNPNEPLDFLGGNWTKFCSDSRNLRARLYPRIVNRLIQLPLMNLNHLVIVNGLPFKTVTVNEWEIQEEFGGYCPKDALDYKERVVPWQPQEMPVPLMDSLFSKTFMIKPMPPAGIYPHGWLLVAERSDMKNTIKEADNSVFYFSQFFPKCNQLISINDQDAIPIGLLRVVEDFVNGVEPEHKTWVCLTRPKKLFIDMTKLCHSIMHDKELGRAGVQNGIASFVFLMILCGTDYVKGFCKGIGRKNIFVTFMNNLEYFSHMVQWYIWDQPRDCKRKRTIVLDHDLFEKFTHKCYFTKYEKNCKKRLKKDSVTHIDIHAHCKRFKNKDNHIPSSAKIRMFGLNALWNENYWANAFRNIEIDPYEKRNGLSVYGYDERDGTTEATCPYTDDIDEIFKRNFYVEKQKRNNKTLVVDKKRKRKIADTIGKKLQKIFG